jgi:hypothetical protein
MSLGCIAIATEAMVVQPAPLVKTTSFNTIVTTRPDFHCYRLVKAEDDPFILFQR